MIAFVAVAAAVVLGGALIAAQGPIYARMASDLGGGLPAAFLAFSIGALALGLILSVSSVPFPRRDQIADVPLWAWPGGLIGVYVVLVSIIAVPQLGVARYMVLVIMGQLAAGYLYDRLGAFGMEARVFTPVNVLGLAMVAVGATLVIWR